MVKNTRTFTFSMIVTLALLVLTATAVTAAPPSDLHIEVLEFIGASGEVFTASGGAVGSGMVCATGMVDDINVSVAGTGSGGIRILHVLKRFTCGDASGTFDIKMVVKLDLTTHATTANWKIVGGTGSYAGLKGNGKLVGTPVTPGTSIMDVYDGKVH